MKQFLRDIGLFFVMIAALAIVDDAIISTGLRKTTIRKYAVWNDIYNGKNMDNDLVFMGASECWAQCNTQIVDSILGISSYNLGIDGHPWGALTRLRYDTYIRYAKKPGIIVITLDIGSFNHLQDPYEREQFFPYFWLDDSLSSAACEYKNITLAEHYCPMWRYIGYRDEIENGVFSFFGKRHFNDDGVYKGYRGNTYGWNQASLGTMDSISIDCYADVVDDMIKFSKQCKSEGQKIVFVKPPIYRTLQERLTFEFRSHFENVCDTLTATVGVPVLDYWNLDMTQEKAYFYNPSHLNKQGTDIFSTRMAHDLDSLEIITIF